MKSSTLNAFDIPARIEQLPLSREIWRILLLAGLAWLLESYDIGVIGTVLPSLKSQLQLSPFVLGVLAVASTLGIVVAIFPAGWLAESLHAGYRSRAVMLRLIALCVRLRLQLSAVRVPIW